MIIEMKEDTANLNVPAKKAVRAVIIKDDAVLLMHLAASNTYVLPGGGVLDEEPLDEALKREVKEETGHTVRTAVETLIIKEYHKDINREHHIYRIETDDRQSPINMTSEEISLGMKPNFIPLEEALNMLAENRGTYKYSQAIETRELLAILYSLD